MRSYGSWSPLALLGLVACDGRGMDKLATDAIVFRELGTLGNAHLAKGEVTEAISAFEQQAALAPVNPGPLYSLARAHARTGDTDATFHYLTRASRTGFADPEAARRDLSLDVIREDRRLQPLLDEIAQNLRVKVEQLAVGHRRLDPSQLPRLRTCDRIVEHYDRQSKITQLSSFQRDRYTQLFAEWQVLNEKAAVLERYLATHPRARDRERAAMELVETMFRYKMRDDMRWTHWGQDGEVALEATNLFVQQFSNSLFLPRVLFLRAVATVYTRPLGETTSVSPAFRRRCDHLFQEVIDRYGGTTSAGQALVWRAKLSFETAHGTPPPILRSLHKTLMTDYHDNEEVMRYARRHIPSLDIWSWDLEDLVLVDLDGNTWTHKSLRGRVSVISFWATWCAPCAREIEELKRIHESHTDEILILGVSLDSMDRGSLKRLLAERGISWPQVCDRRGFESPVVRRYEVQVLPTTVVLDESVQVAMVNPRPLVPQIERLLQRRSLGHRSTRPSQ